MPASSVIGRGTVVRGNVRGEGSLEILGRVEGDVSIDGDVTLGGDSVVRGNVTGTELTIAGTVQGELRGSAAVLVERGARVVGDVTAPRIGIAPGALVKGSVRTDGEAPLAQPQRRAGGLAQPLRAVGAAAGARPVTPLKAEPARAPAPIERQEEPEPPRREKAEGPPPPVVPVLAKGTKAKKKKREG